MAINCHLVITACGQEKSLTISGAELENYFNEDIIKFPSSDLETRLLLLEDVDFIYNSKIGFISMEDHAA